VRGEDEAGEALGLPRQWRTAVAATTEAYARYQITEERRRRWRSGAVLQRHVKKMRRILAAERARQGEVSSVLLSPYKNKSAKRLRSTLARHRSTRPGTGAQALRDTKAALRGAFLALEKSLLISVRPKTDAVKRLVCTIMHREAHVWLKDIAGGFGAAQLAHIRNSCGRV